MKDRSEAQLAAIAHFENDYFPTLAQGIVSRDIVKAMRDDLAIILAAPEIPLAVAVTEPAPPVDSREEAALESAVEFIGIRDSQGPHTAKTGKGRHA
jgi:hypothetical protein